MAANNPYNIRTDVKYPPATKFDIADVIKTNTDKWFNQTLVNVNDSVVRLGLLEGEFHFHKHDAEDEMFYVVEGTLLLDVGDETHELSPGQGYVVPKGVVHRTRAPKKVVVLMMASSEVVPIGD
jgi:mannose-6-phosphate isomerase-like protein (cupin superfamily)